MSSSGQLKEGGPSSSSAGLETNNCSPQEYIKMLREGVDWINLAQDMGQCLAVVTTMFHRTW